MKAVEAKDLIVGRVYSDTEYIDTYTSFLKYTGMDDVDVIFEFVGGHKKYGMKGSLIPFKKNGCGYFYLLSKKELKQYLTK